MIDPQSLSILRATLQALQGLERDLEKMASSLPVKGRVELGYLLSGLNRHSGRALEALKLSLREVARQQLKDQYGTQILKGASQSRAAVHFPRPQVKLRKGADMKVLQAHLGDQFPVFFRTIYTPTPDFTDHLGDLKDVKDKAALLEAVDIPESTPRVTFESE